MNQISIDPPVAFAGTLTRAEFGRVQSMLVPVWARWYVIFPLQTVGIFFFSESRDEASNLGLQVLAAALVVLGTAWAMRHTRTRAWNQLVQLVGEVSGTVTSDGIEWHTSISTTRFEWAKVIRVARADGLTLAFYAPRCAFYFPRSFFESEEAWTAFNAVIDARTQR